MATPFWTTGRTASPGRIPFASRFSNCNLVETSGPSGDVGAWARDEGSNSGARLQPNRLLQVKPIGPPLRGGA
jgi:hypothetical protein